MIIVILVLLGLCFGSFINAYVWRIHSKTEKGKLSKLSVWHGRSMCPDCHHVLATYDLIPVISWLSLRGKCRYCHKSISPQYPLVELTTAVLFIISYIYWPYQFNSEGVTLYIFWIVFLIGFIELFIYDLRWGLLPNRIVTPLIFLAVAQVSVQFIFFNAGFSLLIAVFWSLLVSSGLFYAIFTISDGKWIGGGDVKLAIILGILLAGPFKTVLMIFLASIIGTILTIILMSSKKIKRNSTIAFGPLLITATIICYLFGQNILNWYQRLII